MSYQFTRPDTDQVRFTSARTGAWLLEDYLEAAELGNRSLSALLMDLFDRDSGLLIQGYPNLDGGSASSNYVNFQSINGGGA